MKQEIYTKVDPRTVGETLMPDDEMTEDEMERQKNIELGAKVSAALGTLFISPLVLMFVWNAFIPSLFALAALNYWQSMGIIIISRLIFPKND